MILVILGFVLPSLLGTIGIVLLRTRFAGNENIVRDAKSLFGGFIVVSSYFLIVASLGGVTAPQNIETFIRYALTMTSLTLPIWGVLGFLVPPPWRHVE